MGTEKRERQKANRQQRREREASQAKRETTRNRLVYGIVGAAVAIGLLFGLSQLLGDGDTIDATASTTTLTIPDDDADGSADGESTTTSDGDDQTDANADSTVEEADLEPVEPECPPEDGSGDKHLQFTSAPPMCIDEGATYEAVLDTTAGSFTIEMDASQAPLTVNNFVFLARNHYYEGVPFHRIIPDFVVQGGDAVGNVLGTGLGTGGPGYTFADELPEAGAYEIGSVAMANSGPDTNGSQFFVITGPNGVALDPLYSLFGQVTDGMDTVEALAALGTPDGTPSETALINSVTINQK